MSHQIQGTALMRSWSLRRMEAPGCVPCPVGIFGEMYWQGICDRRRLGVAVPAAGGQLRRGVATPYRIKVGLVQVGAQQCQQQLYRVYFCAVRRAGQLGS